MSIRYIGLTALESHWGSAEETVLLGEGCCVRGGEERWRAYPPPIDTFHFAKAEDYFAAVEYCNKMADKAFPQLAGLLEKHYRLGYGVRFYERLLFTWLTHYVEALYIQYLSVEKAHALYPGACFITAPISAPFPALDTMGFVALIASADGYYLRMYSDLIACLGYETEPRPVAPMESKAPSFGTKPVGWRARLAGLGVMALQCYAKCTRTSLHYLSACYGCSESREVMRRGKRRWAPLQLHVQLDEPAINTTLRQSRLELDSTPFERVLAIMLPRHVPFSMCECLPQLVAWSKTVKLPQAGVLATSVGIFTDIPLVVLAGVKEIPLAVLEHGGAGVIGPGYSIVRAQQRAADRYYSHGYTEHSLPSPYFASMGERKNTTAPVLVCSDIYRFLPRIGYAEYVHPVEYHEQRKIFLRAIAECKRPHVRPYFQDCGWGGIAGLAREFPGLTVQDAFQTPMEQALADSCLIVMDHAGTTIPRALAVNKPLLVFANAATSTPPSSDQIARLREVGIWHDSPESAAAFYNTLIEDDVPTWKEASKRINAWWFSPQVQAARAAFCHVCARTSPDWARQWTEAFDALAKEGPRIEPL